MFHFPRRLSGLNKHSLFRRCSSSASPSSALIVHGHYVSQPARSVLWLLKIHNQPFEFVSVAALGGDTKKLEFLSKFPIGRIPAIQDGAFNLGEGSAIMQYLCEKHGWNEWYPQGYDEASLEKRAKINAFLSYHHHGTRMISHKIAFKLFQKQFFKKDYPETQDELRAQATKIINNFEKHFLKEGPFVAGFSSPTIADLFAYAEIYQLVFLSLMAHDDLSPAVQAWAKALQALPAHDDVHKSVQKLGAMIAAGEQK